MRRVNQRFFENLILCLTDLLYGIKMGLFEKERLIIKKSLKNPVCLCVVLVLLLMNLSACGNENPEVSADEGGRLHIVVSIFPVYDWVVNILGDASEEADITLLVDNGTDLHSYQPSARDLVQIADCDLFIYVGGESDEWVSEVIAQYDNPDRTVISLIDLLGDEAKAEELVEGMQAESSGWLSGLFGGHDQEADDEAEAADDSAGTGDLADVTEGDEAADDAGSAGDTDEEEDVEYDEHVWLSLRNAALFTQAIAEELVSALPEAADTIHANADDYIAQLEVLDEAYQAAVEAGSIGTLLFADRFAFRYLTDDYGLDYYAAFPGCSAETQASFETVLFLAQKVDELGLKHIMISESGDTDIAETVISASKAQEAQILVLDSMQAVTAGDIAEGTTYLGVMEENLEVLRRALE